MRVTRFVRLVIAVVALTFAAPAYSQGPREGIVVHGRWVLEVRNPDGTLAERREFQNAIKNGDIILTRLLARQGSMGPWRILLHRSPVDSPFLGPAGDLADAALHETGHFVSPSQFTAYFPGLTVAMDGPADHERALVLSGTATAAVAGGISEVETWASLCSRTNAPGTCGSAQGDQMFILNFTGTVLKNSSNQPTPLQLVKGQIVQVTVTISFSSPS